MRKLVAAALVGILTLVVTAVAMGAGGSGTSGTTVQNYDQTYSAKKPSKSTGTTFGTSSTDDTNTAKNKQPKRTTNFDITFPAGSKIDSKGAVICKATDDEMIQAGGKPACPKSVIGAGSAKVKLPFPGSADINATVTAFAAVKGLILYVDPSPIAQPIILHSKFQGNLKNGPTLSTPVPPNCLPPATNQGGQCKKQDGSAGQEAILSHFDLKTLPKKKGTHILIRTPKKCKATWTATATLKYADGTSKKIPSKQACKK
jgi:hypothetical protein